MSELADRVLRILVDDGAAAAHIVDGLCLDPGVYVRHNGPGRAVACWLGANLRILRGPKAQDMYGEWAKIVSDAAPDLVVVVGDDGLCIEQVWLD